MAYVWRSKDSFQGWILPSHAGIQGLTSGSQVCRAFSSHLCHQPQRPASRELAASEGTNFSKRS